MKILHISDTHTYHKLLNIPDDIDMIIHSGDCSNEKNVGINGNEVLDFLDWYEALNVRYKIWVAGNHDTSLENKYVNPYELCKTVTYLENEHITIEGINIWGSPYTPSFGDWSFMKKRGRMYQVWGLIPSYVDILVTHGPPKGFLDLSLNTNGAFEQVGCKELFNALLYLFPKYHLFGHIHNHKTIYNQGLFQSAQLPITFSNGSVVEDGKFGILTSHGNIINY